MEPHDIFDEIHESPEAAQRMLEIYKRADLRAEGRLPGTAYYGECWDCGGYLMELALAP